MNLLTYAPQSGRNRLLTNANHHQVHIEHGEDTQREYQHCLHGGVHIHPLCADERGMDMDPSMQAMLVFSLGVFTMLYAVSYTHLRAHETDSYLVCRLLLEKKKTSSVTSRLIFLV